jgi:hypothetical protein
VTADADTAGHGGRTLRDARQRDRTAARPVRVLCRYTRRLLRPLTEPPTEALLVDVAAEDLGAVRDNGWAPYCDKCRCRHRVRLDRLANAYADATRLGGRVITLPLL